MTSYENQSKMTTILLASLAQGRVALKLMACALPAGSEARYACHLADRILGALIREVDDGSNHPHPGSKHSKSPLLDAILRERLARRKKGGAK
jgi:hypothetical protein